MSKTDTTPHVRHQLAYYRDLTADERAQVDAHVAHCAECQRVWRAYQQHEAALRTLPARRAPASPPPLRPRWGVRQWVGNSLVLGGLAMLLVLAAWQWQAMPQGTLTPASLQPGLNLPPTRLEPPSPWLEALPWLAGALLSVGGVFVLSRRNVWLTVLGAGLAGLWLISFVPPFSALPNPLGVYWRLTNSYTYDPRLPFRNTFVLAGDPAAVLRPTLDKLIGQTGLSPLDPNQPLARYEFTQVSQHPREGRIALVFTRFVYADGRSRVYPVPVFGPVVDVLGFWQAGWRNDGLERLRSEHLAFPEQPFASAAAPVQLGPAQQLNLHPQANRLDEANPKHWLWTSTRLNQLAVAPDGQNVLTAIDMGQARRDLWRVPLDGTPPQRLASGDVRAYGWSADGAYVVYTALDPGAQAVQATRPFAIYSVAWAANDSRAEYRSSAVTLVTGLATPALPGLTAQGVWFHREGALWRAPYGGGASTQVAVHPTLNDAASPRPTADGRQVAYACAQTLCLLDTTTGDVTGVPEISAAEIAWSPAGDRLAVIDRDTNNLRPVVLRILTASGEAVWQADMAPRDATDAPLWTPDGRVVLVETFPQDGRRLIAAHLPTQSVWDLSREHWDAYFTLIPGSHRLVMNNGRGDYWTAEVLVAP